MTQFSSTMKYIIQVIIKNSPLPTTRPPCQRQHVLKRWPGWSLVLVLLAGVLISGLTVAYAAGGDLDPTFDTDGVVITAIGSRSDSGTAVAVQGDGKIVVAGSSDRIEGIIGQDYDFAVARYNYATTYGNVIESNEANNVFGPVVPTAGAGAVTPQVKPASLEGLPER